MMLLQGQDRLVRPSEMKGTSLSVPPIVGRTASASFGTPNHSSNNNNYSNNQQSTSSLPSPPPMVPLSHSEHTTSQYPPPHTSPLMGGTIRPRLTRLTPPSTAQGKISIP